MTITPPKMGAHVSLRGDRSGDYSWATLPVCVCVIKSSSLSWGGSTASMGTAADDRAPFPGHQLREPPLAWTTSSSFLLPTCPFLPPSDNSIFLLLLLFLHHIVDWHNIGRVKCVPTMSSGWWVALYANSLSTISTTHALSTACPIKHQVLPSCLLDPFQQFVISNKLWFPIPTIWYLIISTCILVTAGTFPWYQGNLCSFPTI